MSDDKKKDGGIGKVKETSASEVVKKITQVATVDEVAPVSKVSGIKQAGGVNAARATREMTTQDREKIFKMVDEEADKLFSGSSQLSNKRKKLVQDAVKMAIDSGLLDKADTDKDS